MTRLVKPKKNSQEIVSVTPQSAGWRYVRFSAYQLASGASLTLSENANELCVVVLSGIVSAQTEGQNWKEIGQRVSVFEDAAPYAVYVPPRGELVVTARTNAELGVAGGPAKGELPARLIEPAAILISPEDLESLEVTLEIRFRNVVNVASADLRSEINVARRLFDRFQPNALILDEFHRDL